MNYNDANNQLGSKKFRKIGNNTYLERLDDGAIGLMLHRTYVITFYPDGSAKLTSGGWHTPTTRNRISLNLPEEWEMSSYDGNWIISSNKLDYIFNDDMILNPDGTSDAKPFLVWELNQNIETEISTLDEAYQLIAGSTLKALKKLWRVCKWSRKSIAYYAPLAFIPLILTNADSSKPWYTTAKARLA